MKTRRYFHSTYKSICYKQQSPKIENLDLTKIQNQRHLKKTSWPVEVVEVSLPWIGELTLPLSVFDFSEGLINFKTLVLKDVVG